MERPTAAIQEGAFYEKGNFSPELSLTSILRRPAGISFASCGGAGPGCQQQEQFDRAVYHQWNLGSHLCHHRPLCPDFTGPEPRDRRDLRDHYVDVGNPWPAHEYHPAISG